MSSTENKEAVKELEVFEWMKKRGYDRRASKDIAPIIVKYLSQHPQLQPMRLKWEKYADDSFSAITHFGKYLAYETTFVGFCWTLGNEGLSEFDTLEEAQNAAQSDFNTRVLACMEKGGESVKDIFVVPFTSQPTERTFPLETVLGFAEWTTEEGWILRGKKWLNRDLPFDHKTTTELFKEYERDLNQKGETE
jgi:hypothetical protein